MPPGGLKPARLRIRCCGTHTSCDLESVLLPYQPGEAQHGHSYLLPQDHEDKGQGIAIRTRLDRGLTKCAVARRNHEGCARVTPFPTLIRYIFDTYITRSYTDTSLVGCLCACLSLSLSREKHSLLSLSCLETQVVCWSSVHTAVVSSRLPQAYPRRARRRSRTLYTTEGNAEKRE